MKLADQLDCQRFVAEDKRLPRLICRGDGRTKLKADTMLNYDELIILDAEELGEGSIGSLYESYLVPALRLHGVSPAKIVEEFDPKAVSYRVISQGRTYVIYSQEMDTSNGENWGNATFAFFDIVNRQLEETPYRFYAFYNGNDLEGMFLTKEKRDEAVRFLKQKKDWPYLPEPAHPWYGQPH
ncbi:MAG: hypothetical protein WCD79_06780 [Chthoniobacteraceae bacterium]